MSIHSKKLIDKRNMPHFLAPYDHRAPSLLPNEVKFSSSNEFISDKAQWLSNVDRILDTRMEFKEQLLHSDDHDLQPFNPLQLLLECHSLKHTLPVIKSREDVQNYLSSIPYIKKLRNEYSSMNFDHRFEVLKKITKMFLVTVEGLQEIHQYLNHSKWKYHDSNPFTHSNEEYFQDSKLNFRTRSMTIFPYFPIFNSEHEMDYRYGDLPHLIVMLKSSPKGRFLPNRFRLRFGGDCLMIVNFSFPRMGLKCQTYLSNLMKHSKQQEPYTTLSSWELYMKAIKLQFYKNGPTTVNSKQHFEYCQVFESIHTEVTCYNKMGEFLKGPIEIAGCSFAPLCQNTSGMHSHRYVYFSMMPNDHTVNRPEIFIPAVERWAIPPPLNSKVYSSENLKSIRLSLLNTPIYPSDLILQDNMIGLEQDVEFNGYTFSDGCGFISEECARLVYQVILKRKETHGAKKQHRFTHQRYAPNMEHFYEDELDLQQEEEEEETPSAFQIRLGGAKGMLVVKKNLSHPIVLRPSMIKFKPSSEEELHQELHIVGFSSPSGDASINPTIMHVLEGCDANGKVCEKLKEIMKQHVNEIIDKYLKSSNREVAESYMKDGDFAALNLLGSYHDSITSFLVGPFRSKLLNMKMRIPNSRRLYGVVDPYGVLKSNEIFIQISNKNGTMKNLIENEVIITKEPCFHRGDLRRLKTLTSQQLNQNESLKQLLHLTNVIVFPACGDRPIPNTIAGSDLDGDSYFVCWDQDIVQNVKIFEPGEFDMEHEDLKEKSFEPDVFKDWVGVRHAYADYYGSQWTADSNWDSCMSKLSQILNKAVDAPKKGKTFSPTRKDLEIIRNFPGYPHYHQEKHGSATYNSNSIIGQLYDMMMNEIQQVTNFSKPSQSEQGSEMTITALDDRDYIYVSCLYEIKKAHAQKQNPLDAFIHFLLTRYRLIRDGKCTIQYASEFLNIFWRVLCWVEWFMCLVPSSGCCNDHNNTCMEKSMHIYVLNSCLEDLNLLERDVLLQDWFDSYTNRVMTLMGMDSVPLEKIEMEGYTNMNIYETKIWSNKFTPNMIAWALEQVIESSLRIQVELGFNLHEMMKEYLSGEQFSQSTESLSQLLMNMLENRDRLESEFPKTLLRSV
ncbi:hypothetical protein C9374_011878 [Naegleria lovaniensis]|uniref:RNA-dependent RNA polymerase n=1 Tax=Naegleria lovaniensis TaxID=51637 RepID=A0AA88KEL4_NAELO|nr:uncharacterized protein C9374_011878 [Naegleria lovaniensis]KAG2373789.1 hypothetical protein C9374_011878 [Naegleria lovaniensis]